MERFSGQRFVGENWYAKDFPADTYESCVFIDCDLSEATTSGTVFDRCEFRGVSFNSSVHETSRFDNCVILDSSLFDATFRNCKLTGTRIANTGMRPLTIEGGVWSWLNLFGADLRGVRFDGLNLEETDFGEARLDKATFRDAVLTNAVLRGAQLQGADFRGADLAGVQLGGLDWRKVRIDGQLAVQIAESLGARVD